jgi:hypothetical protein
MAGSALIITEGSYWKTAGWTTGDAKVRSETFATGQFGLWLDCWHRQTLFQDLAGNTPVTADGQKVALVLDKSGNELNMIQPSISLRPIFRTTDGLPHLRFTTTQYMYIEGNFIDAKRTLVAGCRITGGDERKTLIEGAGNANSYSSLQLELDDNAGNSGNWKSAIDLADPMVASAEYVLATDTVVSSRFDYVNESTVAAGDLRVNGSIVDSGSYDPTDDYGATSLNIFANRNVDRMAEGRLYSLAYIRDYIDPSAIEAVFATRAGVTI